MISLFIIVFIGCFIGWITNYLAIKLLFHPRKPINFLFFKIQGLIPKRKALLSKKIAQIVDKKLFSISDIMPCMDSLEFENEIRKIAAQIVEKKLQKEILDQIPLMAMFVNDEFIKKIENYFVDIMEENKEELINIFIDKLEKNVDVAEIIENKINNFSLQELEKIIYEVSRKELKHIEYIGAFLGALIGIVQYYIIYFIK